MTTERIPVAQTYWGKANRPAHIIIRHEFRKDTLCGYEDIDVGTPHCYSVERVAAVVTCRRCLKRWNDEKGETT